MSKPKHAFAIFLAVCALSLGVSIIALAQDTAAPEAATETMVQLAVPTPIVSEESLRDMAITYQDLEADKATIKPDSIFHPLKHLGRNVAEMFTFNPVKDAELKLKHANQELSEIKQLIEEKGMENIAPDDLIDSVDWFENKIEKIKNASEKIKEEKNDQPEKVEAFLNNLTDKQYKENKVLDGFYEALMENKGKIEEAENVFAALKDNQDDVLKHFGETLTVIDDSEKISERLSDIADKQEGSEFRLIKAAEILERIEEQVPDEAKEAIEKAQEKTFEKLQEDVKELPAIVRAEKFEAYTNTLPGDEAVQLGIFEKIKQLPDVPQDILEKIEAVKEFAVKRFENKIEKFDQPEVKDRFFADLQGDDLDDIMALEELKAKISAKQEEIKAKIEQSQMEGAEAFKKNFTDPESQKQAERFQRLIKEITTNPNPTVLKLISELEKEVAQDPEKKVFIENIKNQAKIEFENKFRQEGERFFDRIATYNPENMMVFRKLETEEFFNSKMMDQFYDHQTNRFKEYIQDVDNPEMFNRFDEQMRSAPVEVVNLIKTRDKDFGNAMQFKARKMMEMELQLKENEMRFEMQQGWRATEDDFQIQLRQAQTNEEKARLYQERRQQDMALMEKEFGQRQALMETRFNNDPFCDEYCQKFQKVGLQQELQNKKWNLQEDARMREFELEMQRNNQQPQFDPFAGKCQDPKSCMEYCNNNPNAAGCVYMMTKPLQLQQGQTAQTMIPPMGPPPCPKGQINMPRGQNQWECVDDPYYRPPTSFRQCPPGYFWNDQQSSCQFDKNVFIPTPTTPESREESFRPYPEPPMNFCGPEEYWDNIRGCVRKIFQQCVGNEYFDFQEQRCRPTCPEGEYWDSSRQSCIRNIVSQPIESCPADHYFDFFKKQCIAKNIPVQCGPSEYWDAGMQMCRSSCPFSQYWDPNERRCVTSNTDGICTTEWAPVCGTDNITYGNECRANLNKVKVQYRGECGKGGCNYNGACDNGETSGTCPKDCGVIAPNCGINYNSGDCVSKGCVWCPGGNACYNPGFVCGTAASGCNYNKICDNGETLTSCPNDCGYTPPTTGYCGNGTCESNETSSSCPSDCGGAATSCSTNSYTTSAGVCNYSICPSGCSFNMQGCPNGCITSTTICGNGACDNGETLTSCPNDCGGSAATCSTNSYTTSAGACNYTTCPSGCSFNTQGCPNGCITSTTICGNGACDNGETSTSCPNDCGSYVPPTTGYCGNGACEPNETSSSCPSDCGSYVPPTTGYCGNGTCESSETSYSCPSDCGSYTPPTTGYCGDNACNNAETSSSCPSDCGSYVPPSTGYCGDGACNNAETSSSCPSDCGSYVPPTTGPVCGDGNCEGGEYCPSDCENTPPPANLFRGIGQFLQRIFGL